MRLVILLGLCLLTVQSLYAEPNNKPIKKDGALYKTGTPTEDWVFTKRIEGKYIKSTFEVISINSPVKDGLARFLIKSPPDFKIQQLKFKIHNANELIQKEKEYVISKLINGPHGKELQVNMKDQPPGFYRLHVKVKTKKDKGEEFQYKSAYLDYARFVLEAAKPGVPMPDPVQNKATVAGIDSDNDGIRDDVQIWIDSTYSEKPLVRLATRQMAASFQLRILSVHDKALSILATRNYLNSMSCLEAIVGFDEETPIRRKLKDLYLNTKERLYADIKASGNFNGQSDFSPDGLDEKKEICSFNN